jgi:hypothetical protein
MMSIIMQAVTLMKVFYSVPKALGKIQSQDQIEKED